MKRALRADGGTYDDYSEIKKCGACRELNTYNSILTDDVAAYPCNKYGFYRTRQDICVDDFCGTRLSDGSTIQDWGETLKWIRRVINDIEWLDLEHVKPNDQESCLVKTKYAQDIDTYFGTKTDNFTDWEGPGFYCFNPDMYEYYKDVGVRFWLPLKEK